MATHLHVPVSILIGLVGSFLTILSLVCIFIIAVFKRQGTIRDAMISQVDTITSKMEKNKEELVSDVKQVAKGVENYKDSWTERREGIINVMMSHCEDHRGMCATGMVERIAHVEQRCVSSVRSATDKTELACKKIEELKRSRERRWDKQERLNEKLMKGTSGDIGGPIQGG